MANFQSALAVLTRVRMENKLARVTNGLGALNIPYARLYGGQSIASQVGDDRVQVLQAEAALQRLNIELAAIERRIVTARLEARRVGAQAGAAAAEGEISAVGQTLSKRLKNRGFGISRSKLELGPLELGRGGLSLNNGFIRQFAGRAFMVGIAGQVVGGTLNSIADGLNKVEAIKKAGGTNQEAAKALGLNAAEGIRDTLGGLTGIDSITRGILRLRGLSATDAQEAMDKYYRDMFSTREEIARRKAAGRAAQEAAYAEVEQQIEKAQNKLAKTLPTTFKLRGRGELKRYRAELQDVNRGFQDAVREQMKGDVDRKLAKAGITEGK